MSDFKPLSFDLSPADFLNNMQLDEEPETTVETTARGDQKRKAEINLDAEEELTKRNKPMTVEGSTELPNWPASQTVPNFNVAHSDDSRIGDVPLPKDPSASAVSYLTANLSPPLISSTVPVSADTKTAAGAAGTVAVSVNEPETTVHSLLYSLTEAATADADKSGEKHGAGDISSSYVFSSLNDKEFKKTYEMLVISNFIKLYPEMISDLNISRTALSQYDDETREKKFNLCKLYVLIQIESESMRSLTSVFGLVLRVVIYVMFPGGGTTKTLETSLNRVLESTEKRTSALFYLHAVSSLKRRNYEAPNIYYGYVTELLRMIAALVTEYMITAVKT